MMKKQGKFKLLAVDDELQNLEILERILSEYDMVSFTSGRDALEMAFSGEPIDLIFLDIIMPGMDGYDIAVALKSNEITKNIPIIFITGQLDPESIRKGFELGGQDYITKPYHILELRARVATHLKLKTQQKELASINQHLEQMVMERTKALQDSLNQKEALILELTHRVKNMLQMSISLLQLKLYDMKHPETKLAMRDFLCSIQAISLAHNLTQSEKDLVKIPSDIFFNQLMSLIKQRFSDFSDTMNIETKLDRVNLHINSVIPLGLLTVEVLSSLIKAGSVPPASPRLTLTFKQKKDDSFTLEIQFKQLHVPQDNIENLHKHLKLAFLLARQLNGELTIDDSKSVILLNFTEPELKTYNPYVEK